MSAFIRPLQLTRTLIDRLKVAILAPIVRRSLGQHPRKEGQRVTFVAYFADVPSSAYQLEQWLRPLEEVDAAVGQVALLIHHPVVAQRVASQTDLFVLLADKSELVERFVHDRDVGVIFYVNNSQSNFTTLRINGPVHIHLSHGESEKVSMYSNQLKAYDLVFVAGEAAAERILAHVPRIDSSHLIRIGRPQLDVPLQASTLNTSSSPLTVLYAPTWEGDSREMAYSSLVSHGEDLVSQLLSDARFRLVFRPHPKTGSVSAQHRAALGRIKRVLAAARPAAAGHRLDIDSNAVANISEADVVVTDVSSMAMDALGMNKPLVLCSTGLASAEGLKKYVTSWLDVTPEGAADELYRLAAQPVLERQEAYRHHVFATSTPSEAVQRFVAESTRAAELADNT